MLAFAFKGLSIGVKENLQEEDNHSSKGQMARPQCVLCSEVLLFNDCTENQYNQYTVEPPNSVIVEL